MPTVFIINHKSALFPSTLCQLVAKYLHVYNYYIHVCTYMYVGTCIHLDTTLIGYTYLYDKVYCYCYSNTPAYMYTHLVERCISQKVALGLACT